MTPEIVGISIAVAVLILTAFVAGRAIGREEGFRIGAWRSESAPAGTSQGADANPRERAGEAE